MTWTLPWRRSAGMAAPERKESGYGFVALHMQADADWTRRDYAALAREGFMRNPVAHRCVKLVAQAAAGLPLHLMDGDVEISDHPLLELLARPNPRLSQVPFLEALHANLSMAGSAYVEPVEAGGSLRELHLLRPDRVNVVADEQGWPTALDYRAGGAKRRVPIGPAASGGALQLTLFHPLDDHYGLAPMEAAQTALDIHNAAARWNKALLDNSARPSGALVYAPKEGGNLSDEQYTRLRAELEDGYSGARRAGRPLLLDGGLDWKAMALSPRDMDFIEAKNAAARDIAFAFGVPPMLLGIAGDNTYANYQEANRSFYRLTVMPQASRVAQDLCAWLAGGFGSKLRLVCDADQVEGMAHDRDAIWARVGAATFLTEDEKRAAVGYGPKG